MNTVLTHRDANVLLQDRAVPSLRANFRWTFAGQLLYSLCQWAMISILAKAGSSAVVGEFALGLAISAPVFMLTNLSLRAVQATDARSSFEFADYFSLRVLTSFIGLFAVALITLGLHADRSTKFVVLLVAVSKAVESLSNVIAGLLQKFERLDQVAISLIFRGGLSLAAFGGAFHHWRSLIAAVAALVIAWSLTFAIYDIARALAVLKGAGFFRFRRASLQKLLTLSAPLGVVMALSSLNINIPRYVLVKYLGEADLGVFASLSYLLIAVTLIVNALGQSASARLSRLFAAGDLEGFRGILKKLLLLAAFIPALGIPIALLFGRPLLSLLYRPEYGNHVGVLVIMVITAALTAIGSFMGYGMTAVHAFRAQVPVMAATLTSTIVLCFMLIPRMGLIGAALALLASEVVYAGGLAFGLYRALNAAGGW
ncbi:MAG: hypothetical protein ABI383_03805 [Acidobacteriaceae bacterium]